MLLILFEKYFKDILSLSFIVNPFFRFTMSILTALFLNLLFFPCYIRLLCKFNFGQEIRADGPIKHLKKQGTPTAGGLFILLSIYITMLIWVNLKHAGIWFLTIIMFGYGAIGLFDDYKKIKYKNTKGISGYWKLFWQSMIGIFVFWLYTFNFPSMPFSLKINIPFISCETFCFQFPLELYGILSIFILIGTSNGVNLTDGLDGLAIVPVVISGIVFSLFAYIIGANLLNINLANYFHIISIPGTQELVIFCGAIIGAGIGFLWYNTYPALVFMGDTGSLSLGGIIGLLSILTKTELISFFLYGIFFVEILSVIIQVLFFRFSKGRRIFKMAPIHHHFELSGCPESRLIVRTWILSGCCALFAIISLMIKIK